jgi:hypothetical protein
MLLSHAGEGTMKENRQVTELDAQPFDGKKEKITAPHLLSPWAPCPHAELLYGQGGHDHS